MPALSCLRCSAYFLDAVGPRGWRDGCGAQVARCVGTGTAWRVSDGEARSAGPQAAAGISEMTGGGACGKQARPAPQCARPVRPDRMPLSHGAKPVRPDRMPLPRKGRADVARKGAFFAHSAKKGCIRRGSCQPGPWGRRNARREMGGDADVGTRWARCGRRSATRVRRRRRTMVVMGGDERGICSVAT